MLAIARAIVEPRDCCLIDEPTKGLAPAIIAQHDRGLPRAEGRRARRILLVEQNFAFARPLGDTVAVMDDGRIVHTRRAWRRSPPTTALQQRLLGLSLEAHQ